MYRTPAIALLTFFACVPGSPVDETSSADDTTEVITSTTTSAGTAGPTSSDATTSTGDPVTSTSSDEPTATTTGDETTADTSLTTTSTTGPVDLCGNGMLDDDEGEECDDANLDNSDACLNDCTIATCGDGFVRVGVEPCDDGNDDDTDDCLSTCAAPTCGDGFVWAGHEECDDANDSDDDGCEEDCTDYAFWSGVALDVPEADLDGWTLCFDSTVTDGEFTQAKLDCLSSSDPNKQYRLVLIGCEQPSTIDGSLDLAAMAPRGEVMSHIIPTMINGAWWSLEEQTKVLRFATTSDSSEPPVLTWGSSGGACGEPGVWYGGGRRVVYVR